MSDALINKFRKIIVGFLISLSFLTIIMPKPVEAAYDNVVITATINTDSGLFDAFTLTGIRSENLTRVGKTDNDWDIIPEVLPEDRSQRVWPLSFPGIKGAVPNSKDKSYANFVSKELVSSLNQAMQTISEAEGIDIADNWRNAFYLAEGIANYTVLGEPAVINISGKDITLSNYFNNVEAADISNDRELSAKIAEDYRYMGVDENNFKWLLKGNKQIMIAVSWPKGLKEGQGLYDDHAEDIKGNENTIPDEISIRHIVETAYVNKVANNADSASAGNISEPSDFEKSLTQTIGGIFDWASGLLGLETLEDLVFNEGGREYNYYLGIMNQNWFNGANVILWICQVIAIFIIGLGIAVMLLKKGAATISAVVRSNIKENLLNLAVCLGVMAAFLIIFYGLANINYQFVELLKSLAPAGTSLTTNFASSGFLVGTILLLIEFGISFKMNITYIIRALTVAMLYALAPLFISALVFGQNGKRIFTTWLQELIGNIFMQTFHAVVLVIFLSVSTGITSTIEKLALMFCFIPITNLFKDKFLGSTMASDAAGEATQGIGALAFGAAGMAIGGIARAADWGADKHKYKEAYMEATGKSGGIGGADIGQSGSMSQKEEVNSLVTAANKDTSRMSTADASKISKASTGKEKVGSQRAYDYGTKFTRFGLASGAALSGAALGLVANTAGVNSKALSGAQRTANDALYDTGKEVKDKIKSDYEQLRAKGGGFGDNTLPRDKGGDFAHIMPDFEKEGSSLVTPSGEGDSIRTYSKFDEDFTQKDFENFIGTYNEQNSDKQLEYDYVKNDNNEVVGVNVGHKKENVAFKEQIDNAHYEFTDTNGQKQKINNIDVVKYHSDKGQVNDVFITKQMMKNTNKENGYIGEKAAFEQRQAQLKEDRVRRQTARNTRNRK